MVPGAAASESLGMDSRLGGSPVSGPLGRGSLVALAPLAVLGFPMGWDAPAVLDSLLGDARVPGIANNRAPGRPASA